MLSEDSCSLDPKHASDSSEGAQTGTEISQEQAHDNLNLNWEYNINADDGMDLDAMENRHAGTSDSEDWSWMYPHRKSHGQRTVMLKALRQLPPQIPMSWMISYQMRSQPMTFFVSFKKDLVMSGNISYIIFVSNCILIRP
jgi:hypothetical protein